MAEVNVQYINPFLMSASSIIMQTCQVQLGIGKPFLKNAAFGQDSVVIMIGITGEMRGQVLVGMDTATACMIASKMMMGMPVAELDDMAISAISELGNMVMGNAATIFANQGIGIDITPPTLCRGSLNLTTSYAQNICIPLSSGEISIELDVAIRNE